MLDYCIEIAIPVPLQRRFDYLPLQSDDSRALYRAGQRVRIEFANRLMTGVVIATHSESSVPAEKLKPILARLDDQPVIDDDMLSLCRWLAQYYHVALGMVLELALPSMLRKGGSINDVLECHWQRQQPVEQQAIDTLRSAQQKSLWQNFQQQSVWQHSDLLAEGFSRGQLNRLQELELIEEIEQLPTPTVNQQAQLPLTLNAQQASALETIQQQLGQAKTILLEGITGSGKTEVYLQLMQQVIDRGQQCLVLVPEIGLTPQTIARFRARFSVPMVMLHSGLNDRQRLQGWQQARTGMARIVVGTRSAIFTPLADLGLIILDEEHDASFKQQDGVRYSARNVAMVRGQRQSCPVLLGSATPALESLHNAQTGRYLHVRLSQRAGHAKPPALALQSTLHQPLTAGFAQPVIAAIQQQLRQQRQVLVFLNRRGFAPLLACQDCGWMADCQRCDARMTLHQQPPYLHCHHCDNRMAIPQHCPECHSSKLQAVGQGTERIQSQLQALFPEIPVTRVDRDSVRTKQAFDDLYQSILKGGAGILVGTQMLAKGHHFPNVSLVVVVDSDHGLFSADFRGLEHSAQLIEQVAGRAGREQHPGQVWIQTLYPDHPQLNRLIQDGYSALATEMLQQRRQQQLPPFSNLAIIRAECEHAEQALELLGTARATIQQWLKQDQEARSPQTSSANSDSSVVEYQPQSSISVQTQSINLVGPFPAVMERRQGRYRYLLQCFCDTRRPLHQALDVVQQVLQKQSSLRKVRWHIDIDPIESI